MKKIKLSLLGILLAAALLAATPLMFSGRTESAYAADSPALSINVKQLTEVDGAEYDRGTVSSAGWQSKSAYYLLTLKGSYTDALGAATYEYSLNNGVWKKIPLVTKADAGKYEYNHIWSYPNDSQPLQDGELDAIICVINYTSSAGTGTGDNFRFRYNEDNGYATLPTEVNVKIDKKLLPEGQTGGELVMTVNGMYRVDTDSSTTTTPLNTSSDTDVELGWPLRLDLVVPLSGIESITFRTESGYLGYTNSAGNYVFSSTGATITSNSNDPNTSFPITLKGSSYHAMLLTTIGTTNSFYCTITVRANNGTSVARRFQVYSNNKSNSSPLTATLGTKEWTIRSSIGFTTSATVKSGFYYSYNGSNWTLLSSGSSMSTDIGYNGSIANPGTPYQLYQNGVYYFKARANGTNAPVITSTPLFVGNIDISTPTIKTLNCNEGIATWVNDTFKIRTEPNASPSGVKGIEVYFNTTNTGSPTTWTRLTNTYNSANPYTEAEFAIADNPAADKSGFYAFRVYNKTSYPVGTTYKDSAFIIREIRVDKTVGFSSFEVTRSTTNADYAEYVSGAKIEEEDADNLTVHYIKPDTQVKYTLNAAVSPAAAVPVKYYYRTSAQSAYADNGNDDKLWSDPIFIDEAQSGTDYIFSVPPDDNNLEYQFIAESVNGTTRINGYNTMQKQPVRANTAENPYFVLIAAPAAAVADDASVLADWVARPEKGSNLIDVHAWSQANDDLGEPYWIKYQIGTNPVFNAAGEVTSATWGSAFINSVPGELVLWNQDVSERDLAYRFIVIRLGESEPAWTTAKLWGFRRDGSTPSLNATLSRVSDLKQGTTVSPDGRWVSYLEIELYSDTYGDLKNNPSGVVFQYYNPYTGKWIDVKDPSKKDRNGNDEWTNIIKLGYGTDMPYFSGDLSVRVGVRAANANAGWVEGIFILDGRDARHYMVDAYIDFGGTGVGYAQVDAQDKKIWKNTLDKLTQGDNPAKYPIVAANGGSGFKEIWITNPYAANPNEKIASWTGPDINLKKVERDFNVFLSGTYILHAITNTGIEARPIEIVIDDIDNTMPASVVSANTNGTKDDVAKTITYLASTESVTFNMVLDGGADKLAPSVAAFYYSLDGGTTWTPMQESILGYHGYESFMQKDHDYEIMFMAKTGAGVEWVYEYTSKLRITGESLVLSTNPMNIDRTIRSTAVEINFMTNLGVDDRTATIYISYDAVNKRYTDSSAGTWITLKEFYENFTPKFSTTIVSDEIKADPNPYTFVAEEDLTTYWFYAKLGDTLQSAFKDVYINFIKRDQPTFNVNPKETYTRGEGAVNIYGGNVQFNLSATFKDLTAEYYVTRYEDTNSWADYGKDKNNGGKLIGGKDHAGNDGTYHIATQSGTYRFYAISSGGILYPIADENDEEYDENLLAAVQFTITIDKTPPTMQLVGYSIGGVYRHVTGTTLNLTAVTEGKTGTWTDVGWTNKDIIVYFAVTVSATTGGTTVREGGGSGTTLDVGGGSFTIGTNSYNYTHSYTFTNDGVTIQTYAKGNNGLTNGSTFTITVKDAIDKSTPGFLVTVDVDRDKWVASQPEFTITFSADDITASGARVFVAYYNGLNKDTAAWNIINGLGNADDLWIDITEDLLTVGSHPAMYFKGIPGQYYYKFKIESRAGSYKMSAVYHIKWDDTEPELTISVPSGTNFVESYEVTLTAVYGESEARIFVTKPRGTVLYKISELSYSDINEIYLVSLNEIEIYNDADDEADEVIRLKYEAVFRFRITMNGLHTFELTNYTTSSVKDEKTHTANRIEAADPTFAVTPATNVGIWTKETVKFSFEHTNKTEIASEVKYYYSTNPNLTVAAGPNRYVIGSNLFEYKYKQDGDGNYLDADGNIIYKQDANGNYLGADDKIVYKNVDGSYFDVNDNPVDFNAPEFDDKRVPITHADPFFADKAVHLSFNTNDQVELDKNPDWSGGVLNKQYYFYAVSGAGRISSAKGPYRVMIDTNAVEIEVVRYESGTESYTSLSALNSAGWTMNEITVYILVTGLPTTATLEKSDVITNYLKITSRALNTLKLLTSDETAEKGFTYLNSEGEYVFFYTFEENETINLQATARNRVDTYTEQIAITTIDKSEPHISGIMVYKGATDKYLYATDGTEWTGDAVRFVFTVTGAGLSSFQIEYTTDDRVNDKVAPAPAGFAITPAPLAEEDEDEIKWIALDPGVTTLTVADEQNVNYYFRLTTVAGWTAIMGEENEDGSTEFEPYKVQINNTTPVFDIISDASYSNYDSTKEQFKYVNNDWVSVEKPAGDDNILSDNQVWVKFAVTFSGDVGTVEIGNKEITESDTLNQDNKTLKRWYIYRLTDNKPVTITAKNVNGITSMTETVQTQYIDTIKPIMNIFTVKTSDNVLYRPDNYGNTPWTHLAVIVTLKVESAPLSAWHYEWTNSAKVAESVKNQGAGLDDDNIWSSTGFVGDTFEISNEYSFDGEYYFRVVSEVELKSDIASYRIKINVDDPTIENIQEVGSGFTTGNVEVTFDVTFYLAVGSVTIDGTLVPLGTPVTVAQGGTLAADGETLLTYRYTHTFNSNGTANVRAYNVNGVTYSEEPITMGRIDKGTPTFDITWSTSGNKGVYYDGDKDYSFTTNTEVILTVTNTGTQIATRTIQYGIINDTTEEITIDWVSEPVDVTEPITILTTGNAEVKYVFRSRNTAMAPDMWYYRYGYWDNNDGSQKVIGYELNDKDYVPQHSTLNVFIRPASGADPFITLYDLPDGRWYFGGAYNDAITVYLKVMWNDPEIDRTGFGDYVVGGEYDVVNAATSKTLIEQGIANGNLIKLTPVDKGDIKYEGEDNYDIYSFQLLRRTNYGFRVYDADLADSINKGFVDGDKVKPLSATYRINESNIQIYNVYNSGTYSVPTPTFTVTAANASETKDSKWHNTTVDFTFTLTGAVLGETKYTAVSVLPGVTYYYSKDEGVTWTAIEGSTLSVELLTSSGKTRLEEKYIFRAVLNAGAVDRIDGTSSPDPEDEENFNNTPYSNSNTWYVNISTETPEIDVAGYGYTDADGVTNYTSNIADIPWTNESVFVYFNATPATPLDKVIYNGKVLGADDGDITIGGTQKAYTHFYEFKVNETIDVHVEGANGNNSDNDKTKPGEDPLTVTITKIEKRDSTQTLSVSAPKATTDGTQKWYSDNVVFTFTPGLDKSLSGLLTEEIDTVSTITAFQYRYTAANSNWSSAQWIPIPFATNVSGYQWTLSSSSANGYYQFRVVTKAGNSYQAEDTYRVSIDTTPLTMDVKYFDYVKDGWTEHTAGTFTSKDTGVKIEITVQYPKDAGRHTTDAILIDGIYKTPDKIDNLGDQKYIYTYSTKTKWSFTVTATAATANNVSANKDCAITWIDEVDPKLIMTATSDGNSYVSGEKAARVDISLTIQNTSSMISTLTFYYRKSATGEWIPIAGGAANSKTFWYSQPNDSSYYEFMAKTTTGIESNIEKVTILIDLTKPSLTIVERVNNAWVTKVNIEMDETNPEQYSAATQAAINAYLQGLKDGLGAAKFRKDPIEIIVCATYVDKKGTFSVVGATSDTYASGNYDQINSPFEYYYQVTIRDNGVVSIEAKNANGGILKIILNLVLTENPDPDKTTDFRLFDLTVPKISVNAHNTASSDTNYIYYNATEENQVRFTLSQTANVLSGITYYYYYAKSGDVIDWDGGGEGTEWTKLTGNELSFYDVQKNGMYWFVAVSDVGWYSTASKWYVNIDNNPPVIDNILFSTTDWTNESVEVTFDITFTGRWGTVATVKDMRPTQEYDSQVLTRTYTYTFNANGKITVTATGANGIMESEDIEVTRIEPNQTLSFTVDAANMASQDKSIWYDSSKTNDKITFNFATSGKGLGSDVSYEYKVDNDDEWTPITGTGAAFKYDITRTAAMDGTSVAYTFIAVSAAGNKSDPQTWYVQFDTGTPTVTDMKFITIDNNNQKVSDYTVGQWTNKSVMVTFKVNFTGRWGTVAKVEGMTTSDEGLTREYAYVFYDNGDITIELTNANGRYYSDVITINTIDKINLSFIVGTTTAGRSDGERWVNGNVVFNFSTNVVGSTVTYQYYNSAGEWVNFRKSDLEVKEADSVNNPNNKYTYTIYPQGLFGDAYNGEYKFRAMSQSGNVSDEETYWVNIDLYLPVFSTPAYSNAGKYTNSDIKVYFTVTFSGAPGNVVSIPGLTMNVGDGDKLVQNYTYTFENNVASSIEIVANNLNGRSAVLILNKDEIKIDRAKIALTVDANNTASQDGSIWHNGSVIFTLSTNTVSAPITYKYRVSENDDWATMAVVYDNVRGALTYTITPNSGNNGRSITYMIKAVSETGEESAIQTWHVQIDTREPVFSNVKYSNYDQATGKYSYTSSEVTVEFTVTYGGTSLANSPIPTVNVNPGSLQFKNQAGSTYGGNIQTWTYTFTANGSATINALAPNGKSTTLDISTLYIDKAKPVLTVDATNAGQWTSGNVTFNFSLAATPVSPITYQYSHDGNTNWTNVPIATGATFWTINNASFNGTYYFRAVSLLESDNTAAFTVQIDRAKPVVNIVGYYVGNLETGERVPYDKIKFIDSIDKLPAFATNQSITIFVEMLGTVSGVRLDSSVGDAITEYTGFTDATGRVFQYTFTRNGSMWVSAVSGTGAVSDTLQMEFANINKTPPTVTGLINSQTVSAAEINLRVTYTTNVEIAIQNPVGLTVAVTDENGKKIDVEWVAGVHTFSKNGSYRVTVTDVAGNEQSVFFIINKPNYALIGTLTAVGIILVAGLAVALILWRRNSRALKRLKDAAMMNDDDAKFVMFKRVK